MGSQILHSNLEGLNLSIQDPVLSVAKFAERTGFPPETVRKMVSDGRLPIIPKRHSQERTMINMMALSINAIPERILK